MATVARHGLSKCTSFLSSGKLSAWKGAPPRATRALATVRLDPHATGASVGTPTQQHQPSQQAFQQQKQQGQEQRGTESAVSVQQSDSRSGSVSDSPRGSLMPFSALGIPWSEALLPSRIMSHLLDDFWSHDPFLGRRRRGGRPAMSPYRARWPLDLELKESDKEYELLLDMPGLSKEHLKIYVEGGDTLVIKGDVKTEEGQEDVRTARYSNYSARIMLPESIQNEEDLSTIHAELKDGVLHLRMPKKEALEGKSAVKEIPVQ